MKHHSTYLENSTLALATLVTGIMAGFFYTYSINVNLAMLEVSGETYAVVQSLFNENVRHLLFFVFFFGGGATAGLAALANWRQYRHASFWLIVLAGLLYVFGVIVFTANVNLPLNAYTESWDPQNLPADWSQTRLAWNRANAFRVFTSGVAFTLYIVALVIRASNSPAGSRKNHS
ncbi:MAG: DUF1772 domain-containing protein [Chloroflexota bacterium]